MVVKGCILLHKQEWAASDVCHLEIGGNLRKSARVKSLKAKFIINWGTHPKMVKLVQLEV